MKKVFFRFAPGAGGHWLRHLIYCAENNDFTVIEKTKNYHSHKLSSSVTGDHVTDSCDFLLSSTYTFNLWLNNILKNGISDIPDDWYKNTDPHVLPVRHCCSTEWENLYESNIDIDISWTSTDPQKLLDTLYRILTDNNIQYTKNTPSLLEKTNQFVNTCVDPFKFIGNLNDRYWLAWCLGLCKSQDVLVSYENEQQVQDFVYKDQDYFSEKALKRSYRI
jgi:hypothetical protein